MFVCDHFLHQSHVLNLVNRNNICTDCLQFYSSNCTCTRCKLFIMIERTWIYLYSQLNTMNFQLCFNFFVHMEYLTGCVKYSTKARMNYMWTHSNNNNKGSFTPIVFAFVMHLDSSVSNGTIHTKWWYNSTYIKWNHCKRYVLWMDPKKLPVQQELQMAILIRIVPVEFFSLEENLCSKMVIIIL